MWRHLLTPWIFMAKLSSLIVFVNPQVFDEIGNQVILLWDVMHFWHNVTPCWEFLLETISWPKECGICRKAAETDFLQTEEATILFFKKSIKDSSWYKAPRKVAFSMALVRKYFLMGSASNLIFLMIDTHPRKSLNPWILESLWWYPPHPCKLIFYYFSLAENYTLLFLITTQSH